MHYIDIFLFREIAYINKENEIEGLGRAWLPFSSIGFRIFINAINPFKPKPVGVVLREKFNNSNKYN